MAKWKWINDDLQIITQTTKDIATQKLQKTGVNSGAAENFLEMYNLKEMLEKIFKRGKYYLH